MVQAGVAVALAWAAAKWLWGHEAPFFAPVSAIIALGTSYHERGRRALELVGAVTLGIAAADLLAYQLGTGVAQLALAVFLSVGLGLFFGTSQLFVNQVAVSAVLVFTVSTAGQGFSFARALDALTGGSIALAVAAVLLPSHPLRLLRDAARPVLDELAGTLEDIAAALRSRDPDAAEAALVRARGIDELGARFFDATLEGRETARISPARRRSREGVEFYAEAAAGSTSPFATSACSPAARCARSRSTRTCRRRSPTRSRTSARAVRALGARWRPAKASRRSASRRCAPRRPRPTCSTARPTCPSA